MNKPATEEPVRISVVIPHLNQPEILARCLASLRDNTRPPDEIIVVDNGSDALPAVPKNVTLLQETTPGPGPARNLGVAHSTGDVLAFIDADCLARFDWLEEAERAIARNNILGGDVRIGYVNPHKLTVLEAYESIYAYRMQRYIRDEGFTGTGNLVVRRDVLEAVGPFAGLEVAEDRDWGKRATAQGYEITYAPRMRVYHPARRNFFELYAKWDRQLAHEYGLIHDGAGQLRWISKPLRWRCPRYGKFRASQALRGCPRCRPAGRLLPDCPGIRVYRTGRMIDLALRGRPERLAARWNRET